MSRALDREQPISDVRTMDERIGRSLSGRRFNMVLLAVFASLALTLAAVGIYGIVAYSVTERTHEIGIRLALGAQRWDVIAMVIGQGMAMTIAGTSSASPFALLLTRLMSSLLFGVSAVDPTTFIAIPCLLTRSHSPPATCPRAARRASIRCRHSGPNRWLTGATRSGDGSRTPGCRPRAKPR